MTPDRVGAPVSRVAAAAAVVTVMSLSACSENDRTFTPTPAVSAPPPAVAGAGLATNVETDTACRLVDEATRSQLDNQLTPDGDGATVEAITRNAAKSNIESIKLAGVQLQGRYENWLRADGSAAAEQELLDAARRLVAACTDAGVGP